MNLVEYIKSTVEHALRWSGVGHDVQEDQQQAKWRLMELLRLHVKHEVITALDIDFVTSHYDDLPNERQPDAVAVFDCGTAECTIRPLHDEWDISEAPIWELSVPRIYVDDPDEITVYKVESGNLETELLTLAAADGWFVAH